MQTGIGSNAGLFVEYWECRINLTGQRLKSLKMEFPKDFGAFERGMVLFF